MRRAIGRACVAAAVLAGPSPGAAQSVTWFRFDPVVVPSTSGEPVRLEVAIIGQPSRVNIDVVDGTVVDLKDDGSGGDRVAGDGIFTASIPASTITGALRADDVQRVFVGFLNVLSGATRVLRGNMFAEVYTPDIPAEPIVRLAPGAQATSRIVNIVDPSFLADADVRRVARAFYRLFGDSYDFLHVISTPSRFANRTHTVVRNDVDGIGRPRFDQSSLFGSSGRLLGYTMFPISSVFDGASTGYSHETGHQWINALNFAPFASGVPHWPVSSMATGTMGLSIGGAGGQGGSFRCRIVDQNGVVALFAEPGEPVFNDFDLYLMGLLPPEEVRPQIVLTGLGAAPQCFGQTYTGAVTRVSVETIVAGAGPRVPDASASPRRFRAATILVSRDALVGAEAMWLYSWLSSRAELQTPTPIHEGFVKNTGNPFYVMTGGRAAIDTLLSSDPDFSLAAAESVAIVARGSPATFRISALPTAAGFDQPVTFSCGDVPSPLTCTFAPPRVVPGETGADVTLTVTTGSSAPVDARVVVGGLLVVIGCSACRRRRRVGWAAAALVAGVAACDGGAGRSPAPNPGTPSSPPPPQPITTYTITVTGTSGPLVRSTILTLTVR
jgi:hypothetical protein